MIKYAHYSHAQRTILISATLLPLASDNRPALTITRNKACSDG